MMKHATVALRFRRNTGSCSNPSKRHSNLSSAFFSLVVDFDAAIVVIVDVVVVVVDVAVCSGDVPVATMRDHSLYLDLCKKINRTLLMLSMKGETENNYLEK